MARRSRSRTPPILVSLLLAAAGFAYAWFQGRAAESGILGGAPTTPHFSLATWTHSLGNRCHSLGYSEWLADPLWVTYRLHPVRSRGHYERERFESDGRTLRRIGYADYTGSGYDRGHLAPSYAIAVTCGKQAQRATYLMSNITPQRPSLNQKLWQRLESVELDTFAERLGEIQVLTGPVFAADPPRLASGVAIPKAFYKIYYAPATSAHPALSLAFLMPQAVRGDEPLDRYLVSIDELERLTGLDFLPELPVAEQQRLESGRSADPRWNLAAVARLPARY